VHELWGDTLDDPDAHGGVGRVVYAPQKENTGGSGGFCEGVRIAYELGAEWFWVMDDDVSVEPDGLETLDRWCDRADAIQGSGVTSMVAPSSGSIASAPHLPSTTRSRGLRGGGARNARSATRSASRAASFVAPYPRRSVFPTGASSSTLMMHAMATLRARSTRSFSSPTLFSAANVRLPTRRLARCVSSTPRLT